MKKSTLIVIGALLVIGFLVFRKAKKTVETAAPKDGLNEVMNAQ